MPAAVGAGWLALVVFGRHPAAGFGAKNQSGTLPTGESQRVTLDGLDGWIAWPALVTGTQGPHFDTFLAGRAGFVLAVWHLFETFSGMGSLLMQGRAATDPFAGHLAQAPEMPQAKNHPSLEVNSQSMERSENPRCSASGGQGSADRRGSCGERCRGLGTVSSRQFNPQPARPSFVPQWPSPAPAPGTRVAVRGSGGDCHTGGANFKV